LMAERIGLFPGRIPPNFTIRVLPQRALIKIKEAIFPACAAWRV